MPTDQITPGTADQNLAPTAAGDWKKSADFSPETTEVEGFITDLPSGNRIKMFRTLDMALLLKTGRVPNPLAGIVQGMIDARTMMFPVEKMDMEVMEQFLDLQHETIVRCVISPPFDMPDKRGWANGKKLPLRQDEEGKTIPAETAEEYHARLEVWQPREGSVSVFDLSIDDRNFIFATAQGAAADLATFRTQQDGAVAGLQASRPVRKPTKRTGGAGPRKKK